MKRKFTAFAASIAASISILGNTFSVQAATVDDVASVARSLGVSESVIQQGYNEYYKNPDKYTSQDFDNAISCLYLYEEDLDDMIAQYFGIPNNNNNNSTTQPATTAPPNKTKPSDASAGNSNDNANNNKTPEDTNPSNNERPIKQSDFINMFDCVWIVESNRMEQIRRIMTRDGISAEYAEKILKTQSDRFSFPIKTVKIENNGDLDLLRKQISVLL